MANKLNLLLEAERRGILPPEKLELLAEARKRGLVPSDTSEPSQELGPPAAGVPEPSQALESPAVARFFKNIVQSFDPRPIVQAVTSPIDTGKGMIAEHDRLAQRSQDKLDEGDFLGGSAMGAASKIPIIGPAIAGIAEQIGSGDVAGGLGSIVGTAGGAVLPGGAAKVLKSGLPANLARIVPGGSSEFLKSWTTRYTENDPRRVNIPRRWPPPKKS